MSRRELVGVEGTLPSLENPASEACLTTEMNEHVQVLDI